MASPFRRSSGEDVGLPGVTVHPSTPGNQSLFPEVLQSGNRPLALLAARTLLNPIGSRECRETEGSSVGTRGSVPPRTRDRPMGSAQPVLSHSIGVTTG
jgi:hypothetical protein